MGKAVASINLSSGVEANNNARQVATNYLASDDTGIMVAELSGSSETPSTATGNNVRITSTSVDIRKGQTNLTTVGQSGMQIYADDAYHTQIANLGYGTTVTQGGTGDQPYYDLGRRMAGTNVGMYSAVIGYGNEASNMFDYAEGGNTVANGGFAHAEGYQSIAHGTGSHAEGWQTEANGNYSHSQGQGTKTSENSSTVLGKFNSATSGYSVVVGGGTADDARADILKVDWNGNVTAGNVNVGSVTASNNVSVTGNITASGNITATGTISQKKATYDGNATGANFWNSAITTRTDADLIRIGNTVFCYLRFTSPSTVSSSQAIATIPSGYRPNHTCCFTASIAWENGTNCPITVGTGGAVAFVNTAFTASKSYIVCGTWLTENTFP